MFTAKVVVKLKKTVLDPQGKTIKNALETLGYKNIEDLRAGKFFELKIDAKDRNDAEKIVDEICRKVLTNPVIEEYEFIIDENSKL